MRRAWRPAILALAAMASLGAAALLPARVDQVARTVEEVRGRRFSRPVPASEIDGAELKHMLREKIAESFPTSAADTMRTLAAFGLIENSPGLVERLVDFYAGQVVAFYDPEPQRFFVVRGADQNVPSLGLPGADAMADKLIFSHELTHALQDQAMHLDRQMKALKDDGDRGLALQCLLEGEATVVMVRAVARDLPGDSTDLEDSLEPLLSAGALERANVPKDLPDYFVDQLFFPYVDGTAYVRRALKKGGWKAVDELWKSPPRSTSEILHQGARYVPVENLLPGGGSSLGPAASRFLYSDTLGEWTVRFILRRGLPEAEADGAAAGWRGDRIAFYASSSGISYLWRARLESPAAAQRLEAAWKKARARDELIARQGADLVVALGFEKLPDLP
ncbi:MAG TPA: hypothetical protein VKE50_10620 [Thermoanaerobaculia bacterium]|nr:hypothetical protein [Thermoanaerobaculia bacterium]